MKAKAWKPDSDLPNLQPGDLVAGRFRIVEIIGSGGFSVVYRAHQEGMNRFVALKVLKPRASADAKIVERFRREALFASQLSHPNTITLFDYGQVEGELCYIAMEYLVGHDLSEEVRHREPMDLKRVWNILTQICRSLSEAHRIGLIHRDLKPENIFLVEREDRDQVKVLDFGVSKALSDFGKANSTSLAALTQEGTVFGTPLYMAPEQAMAEEITPAVDVYALGQMAYEMITGRAAYDNDLSAMDVMLQQINDPPLELPGPWRKTPFSDLIRKCTEKDPYQRIRNARRLLDELMDEAFLPYMEFSDIPPGMRVARKDSGLLDVPLGAKGSDDVVRSEKVYRWELSVLDETLEEVKESVQTRLVVIHGKPGTGRSNLLRAFLNRHQNEVGLRLIHRQGVVDGKAAPRGLEADLAIAAGVPLKGEGIQEVNRLLREVLADTNLPTLSEMRKLELDSNSLSQLSSRRENFFARLIKPFRRAARVGTLIWGIEDLENVDPLTLAFLDRFIREMRVYPSPILLVTTVHPEALMNRPGLMRYAEGLIDAPSTYARHLHLIEPGTVKEDEEEISEATIRRLADIPSDVAVDGSYSGISPSFPFDLDASEEELSHWATLADGAIPADKTTDAGQKAEVVADGQELVAESRTSTAPDKRTQRLELFTTAESAAAEIDETSADIHEAFDTILGYLAQLDERLISRELWKFVYHRVLPFEMTRMMGAILEHAQRFGIIILTEETIAFTDPEYATSLRDTFEQMDHSVEAHLQLASLLHEFSPNPGRDDLRRIIHHSVRGEDYKRAIRLLLKAGRQAYDEMDLDSAREYYLQFQSLIDELSTHSSPPEVTYGAYPEVWLQIGKVQGALGEYGAAEDALRRAILEAQPDAHRLLAASYKLLGDLAMSQKRHEDARNHFENARDLYQKTALARPYVACIGEIGRCSVLLGRPRQAEGILLQAIDKAEKLQDAPLVARLHRYMGEVLTRQARFLEAVDHLKDAMEIFEEEDVPHNVLSCLDELGQAHFAAGLYTESRDNYTRALAISSTRHFQAEHSPHMGLARALAALENLEQAEVHLVEAMSHYSTRNQPIQRAQVQFHLGDLYLAMGRPSIAEEHFHHVFELGQNVGHRQLAFDALIRRAYAFFDKGDTEDAFEMLTKAVAFGADTEDNERQAVARAHIIYIQLLICDFTIKGEAFSTLLTDTDERVIRASHILSDLFRADLAVSREAYGEASNLLSKTRLNAASIGEYGLFIPIARREYLLGQQMGRLPDPHSGAGYALGSVIPPESGSRRFSMSRFS